LSILKRSCLVCGKKLIIKLNKDGTYTNGYYFGKLDVHDTKNWKMEVIRQVKIGGVKMNVVNDPPIKKRIEYWECSKCYGQ
jgi:hypothetical protein